MSTLQHLDDHIIARYTAQPTRLPAELRRQIEHAWQGAPVQLYALADLDQGLRLTEAWLALGPRHLAVAKRDSQGWDVRSGERSRIEAVREAQALVSGRQTAVIRRLLGYLKPYRRQLTLGMAAATVITLVSLVPPYLAGHLIDRVVRPAQAGSLSLARAATIACLAVRAHPAVVAGVLLAQAHGQPDHARVGRHRPALGLPGVRRRGCVVVA